MSLHVHERIDPRTIIEAVRKRNGIPAKPAQGYLFESREENPPLREAVDFYRHSHGWTNRLIAGDSLLVMNSLLEKEGMAGQVQMVYIDPPYGIRYGSNFQPFVNRREVKDRKDEDLTQEPETIRAFRDTWELGIHSYLSYLRDRLLLARELLNESGSCFVQISDENLHLVRNLMDEAFGKTNFCGLIPFRKKTMPMGTILLEQMSDFILWYSKNRSATKYKTLFKFKSHEGDFNWRWYETKSGERVAMSKGEIANHSLLPKEVRLFHLKSLEPSGPMEAGMFDFEHEGKLYEHPSNGWGTDPDGMKKLSELRRLMPSGRYLRYVLYDADFPVTPMTAPWNDTSWSGYGESKIYVVQTNSEIAKRCVLMTTDPGDLVFDPTCGSGTTAYVAEQWGRRWITCDTSRVAIALAKQRLIGATFDYYKLAHPDEGVGSGFVYEKAAHVTLNSITNNEPAGQETLYDAPVADVSGARISGPFTVEAVPAPNVASVDDLSLPSQTELSMPADVSVARSGHTLRQSDWRDELLKTGIRGKGGQMIISPASSLSAAPAQTCGHKSNRRSRHREFEGIAFVAACLANFRFWLWCNPELDRVLTNQHQGICVFMPSKIIDQLIINLPTANPLNTGDTSANPAFSHALRAAVQLATSAPPNPPKPSMTQVFSSSFPCPTKSVLA